MEKYILGNITSNNVLIQMVGEHELSLLEKEAELIRSFSSTDDFCLYAVKVDDWNRKLSPWEAPAVFGNEDFGGKASETLAELLDIIETDILKDRSSKDIDLYIGGYSLSGLFALWSVYQTDIFKGVASVSGSLWFPGFYDYIVSNEILAKTVYLSLGNKEEKTRNPVMSKVGDVTRETYHFLSSQFNCILEWNEGNHFREPDMRMAKGFAWLLNKKH